MSTLQVVLGDKAFYGIKDDGELLVVFLFHCLDLPRKLAIGIHQPSKLDE